MGDTQTFTMTFLSPQGDTDTITNDVIAGEYYALALCGGPVPQSSFANRIDQIKITQSLYESGQFQSINLDDVFGNVLHGIGLAYFFEEDWIHRGFANHMRVATGYLPSEAMVFQGLNVSYLFSAPHHATAGSLHIDVDRGLKIVSPLDGDAARAKDYILWAGMTASALEHGIFEQVYDAEGMSAIKALSVANSIGMPIYTITSSNLGSLLPVLQLDEEVKSAIEHFVLSGNSVTVSRSNISYQGWVGVGYVVVNSDTGFGGYFISGGLAGGELIKQNLALASSLLSSPAFAATGVQFDQNGALVCSGQGLTKAYACVALAEFVDWFALIAEAIVALRILKVGSASPYVILVAVFIFVAWLVLFALRQACMCGSIQCRSMRHKNRAMCYRC